MKCIITVTVAAIGLCMSIGAYAQNFKAQQQSQERTIKAAYKKGRVTANEYDKLMREQDIIREAILKYSADGVWTDHEKNVVHDKLVRAQKRLRRYRTNGEVY
jgi:ABC-type uncharacterized transport system auxiliary subunit